jgi:hypothetical protein
MVLATTATETRGAPIPGPVEKFHNNFIQIYNRLPSQLPLVKATASISDGFKFPASFKASSRTERRILD